MISKERYPWYRPDENLSKAAKGVFNNILSVKDIPRIPTTVFRLQQLIDDKSKTNSELGVELKYDPILAANIIKHANNLKNSRENYSKKIGSIEHAVSYIGAKKLKEIIVTSSLQNMHVNTGMFNKTIFWEYAFKAGCVAEMLVNDLNIEVERDMVYLASSLSNIGKFIYAILEPNLTDKIIKLTEDQERPITWLASERKVGLLDHCVLGEIGGAIWGFPDYIISTARLHHSSNNFRIKADPISKLSGLANILTHWINHKPHLIDSQELLNYSLDYNLRMSEIESLVNKYRIKLTNVSTAA